MANIRTPTDRRAPPWALDDAVIRIRAWASDDSHVLPSPPRDVMIGSFETCAICIDDRLMSREHVQLMHVQGRWVGIDVSKNGTLLDGVRAGTFTLTPGSEIYSADGKWIVTACGDGKVRIWDAASGRLLQQLHRDGTRPRYYAVAMSPDSKLVAAIELKGEVAHVWDASTGGSLAELRNDGAGFPSLAFSAEGRLATSGGNDVRVFDVRTWKQAVAIAGPHIRGLSWDPGGQRLLTGSAEGDVSIWQVPGGARVHHLREVGEPVDAVAFSPMATSSSPRAAMVRSRSGRRQGSYAARATTSTTRYAP
jgi:WD40 repeat protein